MHATAPRGPADSASAEVARLLRRANANALLPAGPAALSPALSAWWLPAGAGLAAALVAGVLSAALTGSLGIGALCAALGASIAATGAWLLSQAPEAVEPEWHAREPFWLEGEFDDERDADRGLVA